MSQTPFSKKEDGIPIETTRQLLEELDALMQRMLALPVGNEKKSQEEPPISSSTAPPEGNSSAGLPNPPLTRNEKSPFWKIPDHKSFGNLPPQQKKPTTPQPQPSYSYSDNLGEPSTSSARELAPAENNSQKSLPRSDEPNLKHSFDPAHLPNPLSPERLANLRISPVEIPKGSVLERARQEYEETQRRFGWLLWPFRLLNRAFDLFTYLLGPLGSWLRGPGGRSFLAWAGGFLLVGAIGWAIYLYLIWTP